MTKREFINNSLLASLGIFSLGCSNLLTNSNKTNNAKNLTPNNLNIKSKIKPKGLNIGDKVGIIAPSSNVTDPEDINRAIKTIEYFGLVPVLGEYIKNGTGYKTRLPKERVSDLHNMFANNDIKGIFAIRGGYGSPQILDLIDFDIINSNPKIFCGYSDVTALNIAITQNTGLITFHGPVLLSNFSKYTEKSFVDNLFLNLNNFPIEYKNPDQKKGVVSMFPTLIINEGIAEGELTGGNLSLISSLMGTKFEINTKDKIFFIEDVGERPFRIDRMMTQLRLAGKFNDAKAIIIGKCEDCSPENSAANTWDRTVNEVYFDILGDIKKPIIANMMIGHSIDRLTLPIGVNAKLDTYNESIKLLESPIS